MLTARGLRPSLRLICVLLAWNLLLPSPVRAETVKCPVTVDASAAIDYDARRPDGCPGAGRTVNIQGRTSLGIFQFDMRLAEGMVVEKAELLLKKAEGELLALTVSTIAAPWQPTSRTDNQFEEGRCAWRWRAWSKDPAERLTWAGPGTQITDVIWGQGGSMNDEVGVTLDDEGWYHIPVAPEMVEALAIGTQFGLALYDTLGQRWVPGQVATVESGEPGYLLVTGRRDAGTPPPAVTDLKADNDMDEPGQVVLNWKVPAANREMAPIRAYRVLVSGPDMSRPRPVECWHAIPQPGEPGQIQQARIAHIGLEPGQEYTFHVVSLSPTGQASEAAEVTVAASQGWQPRILPIRAPATAPAPGDESASPRVWAVPETASVSPTTGNLLSDGLDSYLRGGPRGSHRLANDIWSARDGTVTLTAGRNWFAGFQLVAELGDKPRPLRIEADDLQGPQSLPAGKSIRLYRAWYVRGDRDNTAAGYFPDPLIPLTGPIELPADDNRVQNQRNQSFFVDLYIPHEAQPGDYTTTLRVTDADDPAYEAEVKVRVAVVPVTLPNELTFIPECNAYSSPAVLFRDAPVGSDRYLKLEREYHRLVHAHRANLNVLGYSQTGTTKGNYAPPVEGQGPDMRVADWSQWDKQFGPYLDGSAFADLPRAGVPVAAMYLPFFENWPCPVTMMKPQGLAMIMKHLPAKYLPDDAQEYIAQHYAGEMPMEEIFTEEYEAGCVAVARDFRDHLKQKGWTGTDFQVYLNNKYYWRERTQSQSGEASSWWLLDEPNHDFDVKALAYFGRLFMKGFEGAEPVRVLYRCDISRISWVRTLLDDVLDAIAVSRRFTVAHAWLADKHERFGWQLWSYSGPWNSPAEPHTGSRAWPLFAWLNDGHGLLYWQTIGGDEAFDKATTTAVLLPGTRVGIDGPVGTMRLKMWRSGQQDVELLAMLAGGDGWNRTRVYRSLAASCEKAGLERYLRQDPETTAYMVPEQTPYGFHAALREAVLRELMEAERH